MARIRTDGHPGATTRMPFPLATGREAQEHMEHPEGSVVFLHACNMLSGGGGLALSIRTLAGLAQVQESEAPAVKREAEEDWRITERLEGGSRFAPRMPLLNPISTERSLYLS